MLALDALLTIVNEIEAHSLRISSRTESDNVGRLALDVKSAGERTLSTSSDRTGTINSMINWGLMIVSYVLGNRSNQVEYWE